MSDEAHSYAIRIRPSARTEIQEAYDRLVDFPGVALANRWYEGLRDLFAELASYPGRYAPARESRLFRAEVHVALHSLSSRSAVYRVLFTIEEPSEESATVHILSVRHASRKPMTRAEAREIEEDDGEGRGR